MLLPSSASQEQKTVLSFEGFLIREALQNLTAQKTFTLDSLASPISISSKERSFQNWTKNHKANAEAVVIWRLDTESWSFVVWTLSAFCFRSLQRRECQE